MGDIEWDNDDPSRGVLADIQRHWPWYLPAFVAMWNGFVFLMPGNTFGRTTPDTWAEMAAIAPETVWGTLYFSVGLTHVILKANRLKLRVVTLLALAALHGFFSGMITAAMGLSTGTGVYIFVALQAIWAAWRPSR